MLLDAGKCACGCGEETHVRRGRHMIWKRGHVGRVLITGGAHLGNTNARLDNVGYWAAHDRVTVSRGRAAEHKCVDCPAQAREWSYKEKTGHSGNPADYSPRCARCHHRHDRKAA